MSNKTNLPLQHLTAIVIAVIAACITSHFTSNRDHGQQIVRLNSQVVTLEKNITSIHAVLRDLEVVASIQTHIQNNSKAIVSIQKQQSTVLNQLTDIIVNDTKAAERISALKEEIVYLKNLK